MKTFHPNLILGDLDAIRPLTHFLSPMNAMTKRLEAEKVVTIHHGISNLWAIECHLTNEHPDKNLRVPETFLEAALKKISRRDSYL